MSEPSAADIGKPGKKVKQEKEESLGNKSFKGFVWMLSGNVGRAALQLIFTAVLSRLLLPADFGIMTIATMVTGFAQLFVEMGVGSALVQKKDIDDTHINSAFTFSLISAVAMTGLFYLVDPLLAIFFKQPALTNVLNLLIWTFPITIISRVSYSLLQRDLKFKKLAGNNLVSNLIGFGFIGIPLAYMGYGFYALVWANLSQSAIYTAILFYHQPHKIKLQINRKSLKELTSYGSQFTASKIFNYWAINGDYFVVSKILGTVALGYYSRAYRLMGMVNTIFGTIMDSVLFPSFAKVQDDSEKTRLALDRGFTILLWLFFPASVFMSLTATEIISILFGPKWLFVIIPFQILSLGMFFRIGYKLAGSFLRGCGFIKFNSKAQIVYFVSVIVFAYIGSYFDIIGVAVGVSVSLLITFVYMCNFTVKNSTYTWRLFFKGFKNVILYTLIVMCIITPLTYFLRELKLHSVVILLTVIVTILASTVALFKISPVNKLFDEHVHWFIAKFSKKKLSKKKKNG
jgi:O-antigen/teichoic acid export membrane protein